jgi:hypothetical protein
MNPWMQYRFKAPPGRRVLEYQGTHPGAIETTVRTRTGSAKGLDNLGHCRASGRGELMGYGIGIDDADTVLGEQVRDRTLAGADATSQSDHIRPAHDCK